MDLQAILAMLTPIVVWLATLGIKELMAKVPSWVITTFVVPIVSILYTLISQWLTTPGMSVYAQAGLGLVGTWLYELIKNIRSATATPPTQ
jgi:hypothetical protein